MTSLLDKYVDPNDPVYAEEKALADAAMQVGHMLEFHDMSAAELATAVNVSTREIGRVLSAECVAFTTVARIVAFFGYEIRFERK